MFAEPKKYLSTYCFAGTLVTWPCVRGGVGPDLQPTHTPSQYQLLLSCYSHHFEFIILFLNLLPSATCVILIPWLAFKAFYDLAHSPVSVMSCCSLSCILHVPAELVHTSSFPTSSCHLMASCQNALPFTSLLFKFCPYLWFSSNAISFRNPSLTFGKQWAPIVCPPLQGRCLTASLPPYTILLFNCLLQYVSFCFSASHILSLQISWV